jgi:transposase
MKHPNADQKIRVIEAFQAGKTIAQIAETFGYHRNSISKWLAESDVDPDFSKGRNPGSGRPSLLNGVNGKRLINLVSKPASFYGFETDFWTTARIKRICQENLNLKVSRMAVHRALTRFRQSFKKPQRRYFEASQEKQSEWVGKVLPKIRRIVKEKKAVLYFEDESSIDLSPVLAKTWGPIGKKVVQKVTGNKGSVSAISAISSRGDLIFNIHKAGKRFRSDDIVIFLKSMLNHHKSRTLVVVMDQAPCHKSKKVQQFILSQKRLNVFYLPPRSPEFNPDEKVWSHLKHHELKSHTAKTTQELRNLTRRKMRSMARDSNKVLGIFKRCENAHLYLD